MALPPLVEPAAELTIDEVRRYSRHLIIPDVGMDGQKRFKNAKVLVIGAGGLGSPALLYLAAAGVGTLGIVEFDTVDESNLQRQIIHGQSDIGKSKAQSAKESIAETNPYVDVVVHDVRLDNDNVFEIFSQYDLIVDGTDNFATRYLVNDAAVLLHKPYVWGSIFRFDGQVSVFWADQGPCYRCLYPEPPPPGMVPSCAEGGVLGVLCASIGATQVTEALKLLAGIGDPLVGRLQIYDALEMSWQPAEDPQGPELRRLRGEPDGHRADRLRRLLRRDHRRGRRGRRRSHRRRAAARGLAQRPRAGREGLRPHRRPREGRARHQPDPRLDPHPQGRLPDRRGAGPAAAGQAGRPLLQDRHPLGRGAGHRPRRRPRQRRARRRRRQRLGQPIDPTQPAY